MPHSALTIRGVRPDETAAVASTLARAFEDDRVMRWLAPRPGQLERGFALYLERIWLSHDTCFCTGDGQAAACWLPPGHWQLKVARRLALAPRVAAVMGRDLPRFMAGVSALDRRHPRAPHWYLPLVGVLPDAQGRGRGSALVQHVLDRCDAERVPAYLEATTERSRGLYERLGFEVTEELVLPRGGPPLWPMWREPGAG